MQKKLVAVAVAGALAAPAVALAQSTVQIYGKLTYEYARIDQGSGFQNTDYADTPGGTNIGFKGEEKLGGGLSAWFQCESSADVRAVDQTGLCTRNSAVGLKGAFGNVHFGRWDTPMKRALNVGTVGAQETGSFGMSFMTFGGSGGAGAIDTAAATGRSNRNRWKRREAALSYYESPKFSGFQVLAAISPGNFAADNAATTGTTNAKPRVTSLAGIYQNGPLGIALGYEKHDDFSATAGAGDDDAWSINGAYKFGKVKVGATYLDAKYKQGPGLDMKKTTYTIGIDWEIQGPHGFEAQYGHANDTKGSCTTVTCGNISDIRVGPNTGGDQYSLAYVYAFSKRTEGRLIYVRVNNDSRAGYKLGSGNTNVGQDQSAWGFHLSHRF